MSDIEDEVKCSECPNARHGFDRNASHNEGRYVCQCESHKCPAESLRQQLAEANAEIERLRCMVDEIQAARHVHREHNRLLTNLASIQASEQQLRGFVETLWQIIDDIDTYGDMAKSDDKLYRAMVERRQKDRWKTGITTDGYTLSIPADTSELQSMIAKAGEVMRERCRKVAFDMAYADSMAVDVSQTIRALPGVTLDDLKD